jgi:intracellular sulfur oxidation DsrE/DsrF family protein
MSSEKQDRRALLLAGLGMATTSVALGARGAQAQPATTPFVPARHEQDAWMSAMPGRHRVVPDGIRFAGNLFTGNTTGYGVEDAEMALIMVLRHSATAYGYNDAIWSKYGKTIDAKATPPPVANPFNSGERTQLSGLAKRGVQFIVCGTASRGLAGRIAGQGGDADAVLTEMSANLIPNARIVSAGVVGVTHAQEHGFTLLYVG